MTDSNPKCTYHPNRDAITKCEMCQKVICVECKNVFQQRHSTSSTSHYGSRSRGYGGSYSRGSGRYSSTSYYYTRHELCTPCFYERKIKALESPFKYCFILFGIVFTAVAIFMTSAFLTFAANWGGSPSMPSPAPFVIVPIIFVIIGIGVVISGIRGVLTAPQRAETLKIKREDFFKNLSSTPSTSEATASYDSSKYKSCPYCGDKVEIGEKICDKCGSFI